MLLYGCLCFFKILRRLHKTFPSCESGASEGAGTWREAAETSPAHGLLVFEAQRQSQLCSSAEHIESKKRVKDLTQRYQRGQKNPFIRARSPRSYAERSQGSLGYLRAETGDQA